MKNLKVYSMNLGGRFLPIRDRRKKKLITDYLLEQDYSLVLLQGCARKYRVNLSLLEEKYHCIEGQNTTTLLSREYEFYGSSIFEDTNDFVFYQGSPIACLNVDQRTDVSKAFATCHAYGNPTHPVFVPYRIVGGNILEEERNPFCDLLELKEVPLEDMPFDWKQEKSHLFLSKNLDYDPKTKIVLQKKKTYH